jgi:hypothetical protein
VTWTEGNRARSGLVLLLAFAAASAALFRMADAIAPLDSAQNSVTHHYEYLTEGFLSGHTYLSLQPAADLLALKDPYRPGQQVSLELLDASLYQGKYYMYYGPGPAVLLMLPWRVLAGRELPQRLAVAAFGALGFAALALLLASVRRRHFPGASGPALAGAFACAAFASWLPVVVRRPFFWELPIVAAVACLWWSLFCLWKFHDSGGRAGWAVAAGAALAFTIASRVTCLFSAAAILALLLVPAAPAPAPAWRWRPFAAAASVVFAAGLSLLAYNHARFGRWLEFGQSYQLWGDDYRNMSFLSPRYIPFNLRMYLFSAGRPSPYFPFVQPALPVDGPTGYLGIDEMYGAVFFAPVQVAGLFALAWAWGRRREPAMRPLLVTLAAGSAAAVLAAGVLLLWGGACSRYVAEFWAGWTVVAAIGILAAFGTQGRSRGALRAAIAAAGVWTAAFVLLASADYDGIARITRPGAYAACARVLDYPSLWWARATGHTFGPLDLTIRMPPAPARGSVALLESGRRDHLNQLLLVRSDPVNARLELVEDAGQVVLASGPFPVGAGVVHARVGAPWLYPPPEHPFWDSLPDPAERRSLQAGFTLAVGGAPAVSAEARSEQARELTPRAEGEGDPGSSVGWVESMAPAGPGEVPRG